MSAPAPDNRIIDTLAKDTERIRSTVAALGEAIYAADITYDSPALVRATAAAEGLYDQIEAEFGLLTSAEAGVRMGSRAQAARNLPSAARKEGRLLALQRGRYVKVPGFQFDHQGLRPVIGDLITVGAEYGRTETGLIQWLMSPTTYLDGGRPVDVLDEPETLLRLAREAFAVEW